MALDLGSVRVRDWMLVSVPVITPKTSIATALRLLREHDVPALPVSGAAGFLGLVDEKALLRLTPSEATTLDVYELHEALDRMTVARLTSPARETVAPDARLDETALLMLREGVEAIAVAQDGRVLGLLTWTSVLAAAIGAPATSRGLAETSARQI